jgi:hypothetical protein
MVLINAVVDTYLPEGDLQVAHRLRSMNNVWCHEGWSLNFRAVALVLADLIDQGWRVIPIGRSIQLEPPGRLLQGESVEAAKERLRRALRIGRQRQLTEPSTANFIRKLQRSTSRNGRRASISDVIDDGRSLVPILRRCQLMSAEGAAHTLEQAIRPIVQVCDADAKCEYTGLRLLDIWRYVRHTWSLEYRSIPGRQMPLLVRNAARPNCPVIGIALLASPIVRTRPRDNWIGWTPEAFVDRLHSHSEWEPKGALIALKERLDLSLSEVRSDDFRLSKGDLESPRFQTILRMEARAAGAAHARQKAMRDAYVERGADGKNRSRRNRLAVASAETDWRFWSEDPLFVHKRADVLWRLLAAKQVFQSLDWKKEGFDLLAQLMAHSEGGRALATALQEVRKAGLSSQVADLSVCGALAPYNVLLGGKLVALLMASLEVRRLYQERYGQQISIISSQMAGRAVVRSAELKILTTTSLYGNASSQYNRLRLRSREHPELSQDVEWCELKRTLGWGTYHLGPDTIQALRQVSERAHGASRIQNIFGEGASPRLRQTREGLEALGIDSGQVLHHATPRLLYGCELYPGAINELIGLQPTSHRIANSVEAIASAWRRRWLVKRILQPEILDRLSRLGPETVAAEMSVPDDHGQFAMQL